MLIAGIAILVLASFLHSYAGIGMKMDWLNRPAIFNEHIKFMNLGWLILFIIGITLVFIANWIYGIIALFVYWFILSLITAFIVKKTILKP